VSWFVVIMCISEAIKFDRDSQNSLTPPAFLLIWFTSAFWFQYQWSLCCSFVPMTNLIFQ
jgi:hypothetical protein